MLQAERTANQCGVYQRGAERRVIAVASVECPLHKRLANLFETGEWTCPRCGSPFGDEARVLHQEYTANPRS